MSFKKNILTAYSAQIISVICSFVATILGTKMLGSNGQGELALYVNFSSLASLFISIGLPAGIVHFIASRKIEKQKIFSILIVVVLVGLGILFLMLVLFSSFALLDKLLPSIINISSVWLLILLGYLFFMVINSFLAAILQAENKFKHVGYISVIGNVFILIMYFIKFKSFMATDVTPLKWILISMLVSIILQFVFYVVSIYKTDKNYLQFEKISFSLITPLLQFAFIAFATNFIQFLSYKMDIWFVNYYHGKSQTGIYSLSVSLAQMVWLLPSVIQAVLYTFISTHADKKIVVEKTVRATKQIALYAICAGICGYVLSIYLVPVLFGEEFKESVNGIGILLLGVVPFCLSMSVSAYFAGTNRVRINLNAAIMGFVICLISDIILIPTYGFIGAAFASVFSYLATLFYLLFQFRKDKLIIEN